MRPQLAMAALFFLVIGSSLLLLRAKPGTVGHPMKVHATGLEANVADPAVIELQYDASLFGGPGEPSADPAALKRFVNQRI